MSVCKYTDADVPGMIKLWNEIVKAGKAFPQEDLLDAETGKNFFASQSYCGVIRDADSQITGLYILHPNNVGRCGHICNASYAVARTARGQGMGEKLVKDSLAQAKALGFRIIQFNAVVAGNEAAHKLYRKLNFIPLGLVQEGFRNKDNQFEDIQLYWRKL